MHRTHYVDIKDSNREINIKRIVFITGFLFLVNSNKKKRRPLDTAHSAQSVNTALLFHIVPFYLPNFSVCRLGLTQEIGPAREEGTIPLSGPIIVPILWNDFIKS